MLNLLGEILPEATAIAFNPVAVAAGILLLIGRGGRSKGLAYLVGWILGLVVLSLAVSQLVDRATSGPQGEQAAAQMPGLRLAVGLVFIVMAVTQLRKAPKQKPDGPPRSPLIDRLEGVGPMGAFLLAAVMAGLNVKNAGLILAASSSFRSANLRGLEALPLLAVFILLGSIPILAPIMYGLYRGSQAEERLQGWRDWLLINNALILFIVFTIMGAKLIGSGLRGF